MFRYKKEMLRSVAAMVLLLLCACSLSQAEPLLKRGQRMVFLGDSITEQRIYTRYVMNYFTLRYPGAAFSFRNAGWGGDSAPGGLGRLQRDVLSLKPNVVSICFGMNDGMYKPFDQATYDTYMTGMRGLVTELKKAGVLVVLLTPGCVDGDRNAGLKPFYNDTLAKFAEGVKKLAMDERLPVYDLHSLMMDVQTQAKAANSGFTMIPDSVHPTCPGQAVMAYGLLKALRCTDQASSLQIDAASKHVTADKCRVTGLNIDERSVKFSRVDDALPTWFDADAYQAAPFFSLMQDLNQYKLQVTGLRPGTWKLIVQGIDTGDFSADQLAAGVNLADKPGPWMNVGERMNHISSGQETIYFSRWRTISLVDYPASVRPEYDAALRSLDNMMESWEAARIAEAANNRTWTWALERI